MNLDFLKSIKPIKREREKKITRLHLILVGLVLTAAIVTAIVVSVNKTNTINKYKKLERDLKTATKYYFKNNNLEVDKGRIKIIKMETVIKNGYLQDDLTSGCKGYTMITNYKVDGKYTLSYDSYIKCGKAYTTGGYDSETVE